MRLRVRLVRRWTHRPRRPTSRSHERTDPQELTVTDTDGTYYGSIIMLAHNGVLSYLDFHTWDDRPLTGLPPVDHLSVVSR